MRTAVREKKAKAVQKGPREEGTKSIGPISKSRVGIKALKTAKGPLHVLKPFPRQTVHERAIHPQNHDELKCPEE